MAKASTLIRALKEAINTHGDLAVAVLDELDDVYHAIGLPAAGETVSCGAKKTPMIVLLANNAHRQENCVQNRKSKDES